MDDPTTLIRELSIPLTPIATGLEPILPTLPGIRCVAFDVYGTLLISERQSGAKAMARLRQIYQLAAPAASLDDLISREHCLLKAAGIEFPEVEIRDLWRELYPDHDAGLLALHYELLSHRVWPMPGLKLPDRMPVALVSNAQFYTPLILQTLMPLPLDPELSIYSYEHRQAKPGAFLFEKLADSLRRRDISPHEVMFVGNDHRKDIAPAKEAGFRTVLFAGDSRSLVHLPSSCPPDAIITHLSQLSSLLEVSSLNP